MEVWPVGAELADAGSTRADAVLHQADAAVALVKL